MDLIPANLPRVDVSLDDSLRALKAELRREFPTTNFSIRRSRGTGYGYVSVQWTDGPKADAVREICAHYEGERFDGMTDSASPLFTIDADAEGNLRRVCHGIRGCLTSRHYSPELRADVLRRLIDRCACPSLLDAERLVLRTLEDAELIRRCAHVRLWGEWIDTLVHRALEDRYQHYAFLWENPT